MKHDRTSGFTLLEIASVMVILGILATMAVPMYSNFRTSAEGRQCEANLKGLGIGMNAYLADHGAWPQISTNSPAPQAVGDGSGDPQASSPAAQWIAALASYGISEKTWHCPTVDRHIVLAGNADVHKYKRIDYLPTNFGAQDNPRQWPEHPWFIEQGSTHGGGPNLLLTDGTVTNVDKLFQRPR